MSTTNKEEDFKIVLKKLLLEKQRQELTEPSLPTHPEAPAPEANSAVAFKEYLKGKMQEGEKNSDSPQSISSQEIISDLKTKLDKVRPTLKKLMDEVKRSQEYIQQVNEEKKDLEDELIAFKKKYQRELEHSQKEKEALQLECTRFKEQLKTVKEEGSLPKNLHYEEEIWALKKELENLQQAHIEGHKEWEETKNQDHRHIHQLESERQRLVERLADSVSQMQRQTDYIKEIRDEISQYKQKIHQYQTELTIRDKESEELRHLLNHAKNEIAVLKNLLDEKLADSLKLEEKIHSLQITEKDDVQAIEFQEILKQKIEERDLLLQDLKKELSHVTLQNSQLQNQLEDIEIIEKRAAELLKEKISALTEDHEALIKEKESNYHLELQNQAQIKNNLEQELDKLHENLKNALTKQQEDANEIENLTEVLGNFRLQYKEREGELRKAQQHLAKKIKEGAILRDLLDRQKNQMAELQNSLGQNKGELTRLQNYLNLQHQHEEKLHLIAKERAMSAEEQSKSWQQKFLELQTQYLGLKLEWNDLVKVKKSYDQILLTINQFKSTLESIPHQLVQLTIEEESLSVDLPPFNE